MFYVTRCYNARLMHNQLKIDYNIVTETITLLTIRLGLPSAHLSPQINKQQHHSVSAATECSHINGNHKIVGKNYYQGSPFFLNARGKYFKLDFHW